MGEADKYIETFRQEADELLQDIEESVLILEDNPADSDTIARLFRAMHTIKGSGAMFGFENVASFTHHVETALDKVRNGIICVSRELIDIILVSRDQISAMMNETAGGAAVDYSINEDIISRLQQLLTNSSAVCETSQEVSTSICKSQNEMASYHIFFIPNPGIFASGMDPALLLDELRELGVCTVKAKIENPPDLKEYDPEQCYIGWEIELTTDAGLDAIKDVFIFVEDSSDLQIDIITDSTDKTPNLEIPKIGEILVDTGAVSHDEVEDALDMQKKVRENKEKTETTSVKTSETVRVPADKLDILVNLVGELVINQAQLNQVSTVIDNTLLAVPVEEIDRLTSELRDIVLSIRMMPIGTTFGRFKRLVRDLSLELGKEIELVTEGAETELDKTVIDRLADPLVHLIRNSIDHGVESPDDREQTGKARKGTIRLAAAHRGTNVVITIQDDGKGLDIECIRRKAISNGLITADQELSEKETYALIFAPGFSLAKTVTSVSGRGVGMDVVKREIEALRGSININSKLTEGTTIELSLPLTLAIIEGLLVEVESERFVIPLSLIEECLELTDAGLALSKDRNLIQVRGEAVPFLRLREIFNIQGDRPELEETIVVNVGEMRIGIVVDHVIGDYQTVIKSLGGVYKNVEGVSGATILGDGTVALILDIDGLIRCMQRFEQEIIAKSKCA